ncbi:MAG: DUF1488 family protein [Pseudomonadota bacterium]
MRAADIPFDEARSFVEAVQSVLFFARVGDRTVRCYITRDALAACFGGAGTADGHASASLETFDRNVECIHEIARHSMDRGAAAGHAVVITTKDAFRAMVAAGGCICLRMRKGGEWLRLDPPSLSCSTSEPT